MAIDRYWVLPQRLSKVSKKKEMKFFLCMLCAFVVK